MASNVLTTKDLFGKRAVKVKTNRKGVEKTRRVGKVRRFVFHPTEKRLIGIMVKRPDLLLMFKRKDRFVRLGGFEIVDGRVVMGDDATMFDDKACTALGVDWDKCVMWSGMPVLTVSGDELGYVGTVTFDADTGDVISLQADAGMANDAVVGKRTIPGELIRGFRRGKGMVLTEMGDYGEVEDESKALHGAILVSDAAADIETEGGVAEAAGKATAKVSHKAKEDYEKAKPKMHEAAEKTGEAVNKGAYKAGEQLGKASGMFAEFKESYDKAKDGPADTDEGLEAPAKKPTAPAKKSSSGAASTAKAASKSAATKKSSSASSSSKKAAKKNDDNEMPSADDVTKAIGRQLGKASGMFAEFKENYDKERNR